MIESKIRSAANGLVLPKTTLEVPVPGMTTDFLGEYRQTEEFAPLMAEAGFTQTLWCEDWEGDKKYTFQEVRRIDRIFASLGLYVRDIHASEGAKGYYGQWVSPVEDDRKKGVEAILNRINMGQDLGSKTVIVHAPHHEMSWSGGPRAYQESLYASLFDLALPAKDAGIVIALENTDWWGQGKFDNFPPILDAFKQFPSDVVGLCYDTGHGNLMRSKRGDHMSRLEENTDRIAALHVHGNQGVGRAKPGRLKIQAGRGHDDDMHRLPWQPGDTTEWNRFTAALARSPYDGPMTLESSMKYDPDMDPMIWLKEAWVRAYKLQAMVEADRMLLK